MSRAFVIKRDDGEYLSNKPYIFTKQLQKARFYISKDKIKNEIYRFPDCKVVEVEIREVEENE